jgi:NAD(P)H dehydrogenase (quinone)
MTSVLVLYYSSYGHVETMAGAIAEGVARVDGAAATVRRVPETVPEHVQQQAGYKTEAAYPVLDDPAALTAYDAILVGTPTRFGNMAAQMRNFWDQTGGLWFNGRLIGKVGGAFISTGSQHGGQETTLTSIHTTLLHHGLVVVGVPYSCAGLTRMDEITGGTPYGATTLAGDGSRQPSENELEIARFQGAHTADVARRLHG